MSTSPAKLYERDFVRWTEAQAAELRRAAETGTNLPLDWAHLAGGGRELGQPRAARARQPDRAGHPASAEASVLARPSDPRRGWEETVDRRAQRDRGDPAPSSPSLRHEIGPALARRWTSARRRAARSLDGRGGRDGAADGLARYAVEQVLDPALVAGARRPVSAAELVAAAAAVRERPMRPIRASPSAPRSSGAAGRSSPAATSRTPPTRRASAPRPTRSG